MSRSAVLADPLFSSPLARILITDHTQQLLSLNRASKKYREMSHYTINNSTGCLNTTNSHNKKVVINYTVADDLSQLLTWLSPLDPSLRHCEIQERRVNHVGEWLLGTPEFRRWCGLDGEGEGGEGVLFCYGNPGVGKTFVR